MSLFGWEMVGTHEQRKVATDTIDGGIVDTCAVTDSTKPYETGISHPAYHGGAWIIVALYDDRASAEAGHQAWVKALATRPPALTDVNECGIETLAQALGGTTRATYRRQEKK